MKNSKQNLRDLRGHHQTVNIHIKGIPKERAERISEEKMAENFPNLMKYVDKSIKLNKQVRYTQRDL